MYVGEEDAKDVLQESFMIILTKINTYQPTGSFKAWLRIVTVRCSLAWLKKKKLVLSKEREVSRRDHIQPLVYEHLNEEVLIGLIQSLPESQKVIFSLHVIEGFTHKEIAIMLDLNEVTSRSHLLRARKNLQKKIALDKVQLKNVS
jgi:RNA polymerase sigma-70 factor (ECF subfamily)